MCLDQPMTIIFFFKDFVLVSNLIVHIAGTLHAFFAIDFMQLFILFRYKTEIFNIIPENIKIL